MQRGKIMKPDSIELTSDVGFGLPLTPLFMYELMQPLFAHTIVCDSDTMKALTIESQKIVVFLAQKSLNQCPPGEDRPLSLNQIGMYTRNNTASKEVILHSFDQVGNENKKDLPDLIRRLDGNARLKSIFSAIGLHSSKVRMGIYTELLMKAKVMSSDRGLCVLSTLYKAEFRVRCFELTDFPVMWGHIRDVWLPNTLDVIESDKHILDISQSLHTQLAILISTVSTEIRTRSMQPTLSTVLSDPAYMRELEKKYFNPLEKTIQVGLGECTEQEGK
jgi:hypothetical protein